MAATKSSGPTPDHRPTICLLYGFCEGRRLAKPFLRAAEQSGYRIIPEIDKADIIVAHSGGCFAVPATKTQQVYMTGLPYCPRKFILKSLAEKNWNDFHLHRRSQRLRTWAQKSAWNLIYFWNMRNNVRMLRGWRRGNFWRATHVVLVRNREDSFCTSDIATMPFEQRAQFVELPDQHDDIWLHPERYAAIIKEHAPLLAQAGE